MENWPVYVSWLIAAFLCLAAFLNLTAAPVVLQQFDRWGLPHKFRFINGPAQALIGLSIACAAIRPYALAVGVVDVLIMWAVVLRARDFAHLGPSVFLIILIAIDAYGFGLI